MSPQMGTKVVGQQLAAALVVVDWLTASGADIVLKSTLPDRAAGGSYTVAVNDSVNAHLLLTSRATRIDINVSVTNCTNIAAGTARGGDLNIVPAGDILVVQRV